MYWNMTGHKPPRGGNIPPMREDWPSLAAMVSSFRDAPRGVPQQCVCLTDGRQRNITSRRIRRLFRDQFDPVVVRTPAGKEWGGVSRTLGSEVLDLGEEKDLHFYNVVQNY